MSGRILVFALAFALVSATGCSVLMPAGEARVETATVIPYEVSLEPIMAPAAPVQKPDRIALAIDREDLSRELVQLADGKIFQKLAPGLAGAPLRLKLNLVASELRYTGESWNFLLAIFYDCHIFAHWRAADPFTARVQWRLDVVAEASGRSVYFKDFDTEVPLKLSPSDRGFLFFSHVRIPDGLRKANWDKVHAIFLPRAKKAFLEKTASDLAVSFAAIAQTEEFRRAMEATPEPQPGPAQPAGPAPLIELTTAPPQDEIQGLAWQLRGRVVSGSPVHLEIVVNDEVLPAGALTRDIAGTSGSKVEGQSPSASGTAAPETAGALAYGFERELKLQAGDNTIRIAATDLRGQRTEQIIALRAVAKTGNVYVLAIGIADYEDKNIPDLKWTENDAEGLAAVYEGMAVNGSFPGKVDVKLLAGSQATKRAIMLAMSQHLERKAVNEEDMVVFFFAGHGGKGLHPTRGTEYYLYPYDTEQADLSATGIEVSELQRRWSAIRAQTRIFISDACHSGGLVGLRASGDDAGAESVGSGSVSFSAARANQLSMELSDLQHGLFTYHLLRGLKGEADGALGGAKDGRVAVTELKAFLDREVPAAASRLGGQQTPVTRIESSGEIFLAK